MNVIDNKVKVKVKELCLISKDYEKIQYILRIGKLCKHELFELDIQLFYHHHL